MRYTTAEQAALFDRTKTYLAGTETELPTEDRLAELRRLLRYHEWRYYVLNEPVLGDTEYDRLYKQLEALEEANPELVTADSPTQRVGSDLAQDLPTVEHLTPMLSLDNSYNAEDLAEFDRQLKRMLVVDEEEPLAYAVEPKYDGGSIALVYENDELVRAATRGNGRLGEEMTANARAIRSVPLRAAFSKWGIVRAEVRGEVIIRKDRFAELNATRAAAGEQLFANPRNTATGGLRMKDPAESAQRRLEAFVYTLGYAVDADGNDKLGEFATHYAALDALARLGFMVPRDGETRKQCADIAEAADFCLEWADRRPDYAYEIDGMVVKLDDRRLQERAGYTSHHPRWAIAYKFPARQATTTLLEVDYQVGKIGTITPVAKTEPTNLAGVTIASISLHNEDFIREKDLYLNDRILIERAGDVIPYLVKALPDLRDGTQQPIVWPEVCPVNRTATPVPLVRAEGEAAWRCPNCVCGAQTLARVIYHVSKAAMDIDGMGKRYVEQFYELGWLRSLADIYRLPYDEMARLEGFGERSAANLERSVERAKKNPLWRLLVGLVIHHLGSRAGQLIAAEIDHVQELAKWTEEDFLHIKDIGPTVAHNVSTWFAEPANLALLQELEDLGVNVRATEEDRPRAAVTEGPLVGKTILFTGTLSTLSRKEAQERAVAAGAKTVSAVSKSLDILVAGEKAGSKLKKAQAVEGCVIYTEEEFLEVVGSR
ncbi:MAG: NAD-dependent DNA ligase LigA [Saprospiraceae bacterium]